MKIDSDEMVKKRKRRPKMDKGEGLKLKEKAKPTTEAYAKRGAC